MLPNIIRLTDYNKNIGVCELNEEELNFVVIKNNQADSDSFLKENMILLYIKKLKKTFYFLNSNIFRNYISNRFISS